MDKRKGEIIEVALKRFCHYGFGKTTMNEIADDLRITKANLYYYYNDKTTLIIDVIRYVSDELGNLEVEIIKNYNHDFLGTLFGMLELRSEFLSKYYMLHIDENIEWVRDESITKLLNELQEKEFVRLKSFFKHAVESSDVRINNLDETVLAYIEVNKALSIMYNVQDIISGIPDMSNVEKVLISQKRITKLMFEDKIITK